MNTVMNATQRFRWQKTGRFASGVFWTTCLLVLLMPLGASASDTLRISFGGTLAGVLPIPGSTLEECTWNLQLNGNVVADEQSGELLQFVFQIPGDYTLTVHMNAGDHGGTSCAHPAHNWLYTVRVSDVQASLVFDENFWYQLFNGQKTFSGQLVQVPVNLTFYDQPHPLQGLRVSLAGVGCDIWAQHSPLASPQPGLNTIPFVISGIVGAQVFAMVDFIDHNGVYITHQLDQFTN